MDRVIPIVMEMERERKMRRGGGVRKGEERKEKRKDEKDGKVGKDISKLSAEEYRQAFLDRARQRRYGRAERG